MKKALINPPVLAIPQLDKEFKLFTDASDRSIRAILVHTRTDGYDIPIHYLSHQLSKAPKKWNVIERECFAIIFVLEIFRVYLEGRRFRIYTDHHPLKFINSGKNQNPKLQRWPVRINSVGVKIFYIRGTENVLADSLSRLEGPIPKFTDTDDIEESCEVQVINSDRLTNDDLKCDDGLENVLPEAPTLDPKFQITKNQKEDKKLKSIIDHLTKHGSMSKFKSKYTVINDLLYYIDSHENVFLEIPTTLQNDVICETHESSLPHMGREKTYSMIMDRIYWKGMTSMIFDYVKQYVKCNQRNIQTIKAPLRIVSPPSMCFVKIAIDLVGPLIETEGGIDMFLLLLITLVAFWKHFLYRTNKQPLLQKSW